MVLGKKVLPATLYHTPADVPSTTERRVNTRGSERAAEATGGDASEQRGNYTAD